MTGNATPTVVAAANLSPVSPRPLHNTYALPKALPGLQSRAEDPDVVPLELDAFRTAEAAMAESVPEQQAVDAATEPTVESLADQTQEASLSDDDGDDDNDNDNESFQYDDGDDQTKHDGQEQNGGQEVDDYARTFDSPADTEEKDQHPLLQQQELVSNAAESINISTEQPDQPDAVPAQTQSQTQTQSVSDSSILPSRADQGPSSVQPTATDNSQEFQPATVSPPIEPSATSPAQQEQEGLEPTAQPAQPAAEQQQDASVQPETVDVDMAEGNASTSSLSHATALDIQKLVDEITAKTDSPAAEPSGTTTSSVAASLPPLSIPTTTTPSMDVDLSSLPPKPALTQEQSKQTYSQAAYHHASLPTTPAYPTPSGLPSQPPFANNGAPGVSQPASHKPSFPHPNTYAPGSMPSYSGHGVTQTYDEFLAEERKNMADAKWERFPDGSRIFIGNLSQERVSKRDVFDMFHRFGRLAQISLKSAYGFVQYHTVAEAQAAIVNLHGAEVKGRSINLEISKTQKTKRDRDHSPDRKNRNERGGRNGDRYDGREERRRRDDYRRSTSPRRDGHRGRQDSYGRDRGRDSYGRKRSRSPDSYRRQDDYRRRSPSPHGRNRQDGDQLDIPRRYGSDVPDVQILLMQDVHKDFVDWVQRTLYERGLKTNAMFFNPRFPRDALVQRQVLEGVHGVVELDMRAQTMAKIPLQVFDRSAGNNNVRFDQYQDLDPTVAAELVLRAKNSAARAYQQVPQQNFAPPPQQYGGAPYGAYQPQQQQQQQQPAIAAAGGGAPDIAGLVAQLTQMPNVDSSTVQSILATLQTQQQPQVSTYPANYASQQQQQQPPQQQQQHHQAGGVDTNAFYGSAANPVGGHQPAASAYQNGSMPLPSAGAVGSSDPARDVENIMASLARYR